MVCASEPTTFLENTLPVAEKLTAVVMADFIMEDSELF